MLDVCVLLVIFFFAYCGIIFLLFFVYACLPVYFLKMRERKSVEWVGGKVGEPVRGWGRESKIRICYRKTLVFTKKDNISDTF